MARAGQQDPAVPPGVERLTVNNAELNRLWGRLIVEEMTRNGVTCFCLSPGSRSASLALALADKQNIDLITHFDERGAAYYALGHARATRRPAAIICTSGTAAANYLPAIVEAQNDHVPLIVITADRPPELRDSGANQTIDQVKLYGDQVNWFHDLPCPTENIDPGYVLSTVDQLVARSIAPVAGPIHLNCMFREPLAPQDLSTPLKWPDLISNWAESKHPYTKITAPRIDSDPAVVEGMAEAVLESNRGLIVAGSLKTGEEAQAVLELAEYLGWPLLPDFRSGLRFADSANVIGQFDPGLLSQKVSETFRPDMVLQFGDRLVSKRLLEFINRSEPKNYIIVTNSYDRVDPSHNPHRHLVSDMKSLCVHLSGALPGHKSKLLPQWQEVSKVVSSVVSEFAGQSDVPTEIGLTRTLSGKLPQEYALFSSSSLAIRALNSFSASSRGVLMVGANRGGSGIDGNIASACGYAAGLGKPVVVLLGDLAALHDLNSLALVKNTGQQMLLVIVNNDGGAIFDHLPIGKHQEICTDYFVMPHGLDFGDVARTFKLPYSSVGSLSEFGKELDRGFKESKSAIIEVKVDRATSLEQYREVENRIRESVDNTLGQ